MSIASGKPEEICRLYLDKKLNEKTAEISDYITRHESFMKTVKYVGSVSVLVLISLTGFFFGQNSGIATTNANVKNIQGDVKEIKEQVNRLIFSKEKNELSIKPLDAESTYCDYLFARHGT